MKRIICFGGGNGVPKLMAELKKYSLKICGVNSMVDNGGSAGQLRRDFDVLPPGDIRRHILALSEAPKWKKFLFEFRFGKEEFEIGHKGHNFANVFFAGLEVFFRDYKKVLKIVYEFMEVKKNCKALPATLDKVQLMAELENGQIIEGEAEIDVPKKHNPNLKIKRLFLNKKAKIFSETKKEILKADLIVIGPGDLYSSLIPCFLIKGTKEAIKKSGAKKIFVANLMTKLGETNGFSLLDFTKEIERYLKEKLDLVIFNNFFPQKKEIENYKKKHPELLEMVKIPKNLPKEKFIGKNLLLKGKIEHDFKKLAKIIVKILH